MLIVVEGCIGAGKSTIAKGLAEFRKSTALLEEFESNPFLSAFYDDPVAHATETEFAFLLLHYHQIKTHTQAIAGSELIADFDFGKDLLYANLNLIQHRAREIFNQLYQLLVSELPKPDLMICLSASTKLVVERIRARQRAIEMKIDPAYYAGVNAAYREFFERCPCAKLDVSMDEWDFVKKPELFRELSSMADGKLKSAHRGTH